MDDPDVEILAQLRGKVPITGECRGLLGQAVRSATAGLIREWGMGEADPEMKVLAGLLLFGIVSAQGMVAEGRRATAEE